MPYVQNPWSRFARVGAGADAILDQANAPTSVGPTPTRTRPVGGPIGAPSVDIMQVQRLLQKAGVYPGKPNGIQDNTYAKAVRDFQILANVTSDGVYTPHLGDLLSQYVTQGYLAGQRRYLVNGVLSSFTTPSNVQVGDTLFVDARRLSPGVFQAPLNPAFPYAMVPVTRVLLDPTEGGNVVRAVQGKIQAMVATPFSSTTTSAPPTTQTIQFSPWHIVAVDHQGQRIWDTTNSAIGPVTTTGPRPSGPVTAPPSGGAAVVAGSFLKEAGIAALLTSPAWLTWLVFRNR